jgi:hypothetical protein
MLMTEQFIDTAEEGPLLAAAEDGDERAFRALVEPYRRTLEEIGRASCRERV